MSVAGAILRRTEAMNQLPPLPQRGRGAGGEGCPHHPPGPPSSPTLWARKGEDERCRGDPASVNAAAFTNQLPPLSRSAGEGPGVRAARSIPPAPFLSHTGRGRGR